MAQQYKNTFHALLKQFHKHNVVYVATQYRIEEFIRLLNGERYKIVYRDEKGLEPQYGFKKER